MMRRAQQVLVALAAGCLSACGHEARTEPIYVKHEGWDSICLARLALDIPNQVMVAAGGPRHTGNYGFDAIGLQGAGTNWQTISKAELLETNPATAQDLQNIRETAAFRLWETQERATKAWNFERISRKSEAKLGTGLAYGFNNFGSFDIGYFDLSDNRIRLFAGGLPGNKSEERYTVEDVADYYKVLRNLYTARQPTDIPTEPGICTPYGFFKEPAFGPVSSYDIDIAVRSLKYPSLIIFVHIRPPEPNAPKSLDELRDPNNITVDDLKSIKGMGALGAIAALGNIKKLHDPQKLTLAGQPARLSAREYHHEGTLNTAGSGSGAAYEMQVDAVGVAGQADKPAITIKLAAALPDPFPYPPPVREKVFGEEKITYYKPARPALKGVKTPPFDEAMAYFKQVLASVRPLSQLHGPTSGSFPPASASAASR